jgi:hypothetical protein
MGVNWFYAPTHGTDAAWYDNTLFPGEKGYIGDDKCCYSTPTWPWGKRLAEPFHMGKQPKPYEIELDPNQINPRRASVPASTTACDLKAQDDLNYWKLRVQELVNINTELASKLGGAKRELDELKIKHTELCNSASKLTALVKHITK